MVTPPKLEIHVISDNCMSDPIFFLHHTQIDRLWWQWQQKEPSKRLKQYHGRSRSDLEFDALLTDRLDMFGLAPSIKVQDVMDTEKNGLCYKY